MHALGCEGSNPSSVPHFESPQFKQGHTTLHHNYRNRAALACTLQLDRHPEPTALAETPRSACLIYSQRPARSFTISSALSEGLCRRLRHAKCVFDSFTLLRGFVAETTSSSHRCYSCQSQQPPSVGALFFGVPRFNPSSTGPSRRLKKAYLPSIGFLHPFYY